MIECYGENIWYKRRKHKGLKRFFVFFIVLCLLVGIFLFYKYRVTEQIVSACSDIAYSYGADSVNKAVLFNLEKTKYDDIVSVEKNSDGDIVLLSVNSQKINSINRTVAERTKALLENKLSKGVEIPLGSFFGLKLLSGYGPPVLFKSFSVTAVTCDFSGEFESSGINQTKHSVYIIVKSTVNIEIPLERKEIIVNTRVLICEAVLVGKVPEVYLNGKLC